MNNLKHNYLFPFLFFFYFFLNIYFFSTYVFAESVGDPFDLKAILSMESAFLLNATPTVPQSEQRAVLILPMNIESKELFSRDFGGLNLQGMMIKEDSDLNNGVPLINDYHAYSNLRAEDRVQLFEVYWEKYWYAFASLGKSTTRLGKIDANDHFAVSDHESFLLNGASGFSPSIFGLPSYPDSAWHLSHEQAIENVELKIAIFDGGSTSLDGTSTGKRFTLSPSAQRGELFYIFETTIFFGNEQSPSVQSTNPEINTGNKSPKKTATLNSVQQDRDFEMRSPFHLSLGLWKHQAKVVQVKQTKLPSYGIYMVGDIELYKLGSYGELGLGFQLAHSPHYHPWHASLAVIWERIVKPIAWANQSPSLSMGLSYLSISDQMSSNLSTNSRNESFVECTLALPLSDSLLFNVSWMSIQGQHLNQNLTHLLLSRLTIGAI